MRFPVSSNIAIIFVTSYFILRGISPDTFNWLEKQVPFIHFIVLIAMLLGVWEFLVLLFPRKSSSLFPVLKGGDNLSNHIPGNTAEVENAMRNEEKYIKENGISQPGHEYQIQSNRMNTFRKVKSLILQSTDIKKVQEEISSKLQIDKDNHLGKDRLEFLKRLNENIETLDFKIHTDIQKRISKISEENRSKLKRTLKYLSARKKYQRTANMISGNIEILQERINSCIEQIILHVNDGNKKMAIKSTNDALKFESTMIRNLRKLIILEKIVLKKIEDAVSSYENIDQAS